MIGYAQNRRRFYCAGPSSLQDFQSMAVPQTQKHTAPNLGKSMRKVPSVALFAVLFACVQTTFASPVIDSLDNLNYLGNDSSSCIFSIDHGILTVTGTGGYDGYAIFSWSPIGGFAGAYRGGFSTDPSQQQNVLQIRGMSFVTPEGKTPATVEFALFAGTQPPPITSGFSASPDIPAHLLSAPANQGVVAFLLGDGNLGPRYDPNALSNGPNIDFDMTDAIRPAVGNIGIPQYGETDIFGPNAYWAIQVVINTHGQSGVGVSFDSIAAVSSSQKSVSEPSTSGLMLFALVSMLALVASRNKTFQKG